MGFYHHDQFRRRQPIRRRPSHEWRQSAMAGLALAAVVCAWYVAYLVIWAARP